MQRLRRLAVATLAAVLVAGCGDAKPRVTPTTGPGSPQTAVTAGGDPAKAAAELVARLSDEELVGQVLVGYAYGNDADTVTPASVTANKKYAGASTPADIVKKYHLGGIILMSGSADDPTAGTNKSTNVDSPAQVAKLTGGLQNAALSLPAKVPLLIGTDQEYGQVTRVRDGVVQLPAALALGAAGDPTLTENAWKAAGTELGAMGLNVDFAPDADVLGSQPGGVIGSRSFGSDPKQVALQVAAAVKGLQEAGVAATVKHFPGHGHTITDSHTNLPVLNQSLDSLQSGDLPPFIAAKDAGVGLIMSGHLDVKSIDPGLPASFSSKVLIDLLRTKLGYTGVVITDALNMEPAERWSAGEAAVRAVLAGNDMLLMPPSLAEADGGLLDALRSGRLPKARLIEAVTRILTLKFRLAGSARAGLESLNSPADVAAARAAAAGAVTILRGPCSGPLVTGAVRVTGTAGNDTTRGYLEAALQAQGLRLHPDGAEIRLIGYGKGASDLSAGAAVTVALDTPYVLQYQSKGTLVATYSTTQVAMESLAEVIAGKTKAPGHSPVPVHDLPSSAC